MQTYVLDSSAMIAFFVDEEGAEKVNQVLDDAVILKNRVLMHNATVAELYYDALRRGEQKEELVLESLSQYPITFIENITTDTIKWIGYFKTTYKISFADCFVLAAAKLYEAKVVTSDHHEFDVIDKSGDLQFEWLR
jgi:predicted nucleic acid-binding protein